MDPEAGSGPEEGELAALLKTKRCGKMLLLRPDVRADAVARGNICNIKKAITELECRAGGPVVSDHLVKGWLQKFQYGYGKRLRSWDEQVIFR